ncbi:hypothetical protein SAG0135_11275 [Streptococcus agalactiae LMG 14609]|uniref:Uncharacterized protein n=1 Tax=Streptococcus agalactiae serotype III (strain NEM316) TaxID=211110 RepID=Q8E2Z3_STRA3|nr:hypothetical protein SAG0042_07525 [Streptococcus agalactiae FSL F2-343]EPU23984.1 hypothetical protein SAG0137_10115 [Streptococcus agalactiae LMG 14838]EPU26772.1 hypothetical protein SAG0135_11275 [Streptococcus agalactiae LMG 14609]EPV08191.1 hypothetical protein SAG0327_09295 [Streptococcus agalactiae GB00548]EPV57057.1 hypothetical protein SAG0359_00040 [Streptococcus agalactiae GB00922]EPW33580.1 hypothetical protein SAG0072_02655 [Streptococcus agalactiae CCUG 44110]EPW71593.1 hypo
MLSDDFYYFNLKKSNQSLQKQVKDLTERLDNLENDKDSIILNKLKRGF